MFRTLFIAMILAVAACATTSTLVRQPAKIKMNLPSGWQMISAPDRPFAGGPNAAYVLADAKNGATIAIRFVPAKKTGDIAAWAAKSHDRYARQGWKLTPITSAEDGSASFDAAFQDGTRGHYVAQALKGLSGTAAIELLAMCSIGANDQELIADLDVIAANIEFVTNK